MIKEEGIGMLLKGYFQKHAGSLLFAVIFFFSVS